MTKQQQLPHRHTILFPASLLTQRQSWEKMVQPIPSDRWVFIAQLHNPRSVKSLLNLAFKLKQEGKRVDVLTLGE